MLNKSQVRLVQICRLCQESLSRHIFLRIGVTRADLMHCRKMTDARDE